MRLLHFLIAATLATSAIGQDLSPDVAYVEAHHKHYNSRHADLTEKLAAIEEEFTPIRDAKIDRRAAETNTTFGEGADAISWFVGDDGTVYFRSTREKRDAIDKYVRLYIDPRKKELADLPLNYDAERPSMSFTHPGIIRWKPYVFQVLDEDEVLLRILKDTILYVKGVKTEGMVDGEYIDLVGTYHSTGTTTYRSAGGGTNTVRVIEPFDTADADKIIKAKATKLKNDTAAERKTLAAKPSSLTREFTDITGTFKVKAEYAGYASGNVRLKKENGETISVPLAKLSDTDRRWVAEQTARD